MASANKFQRGALALLAVASTAIMVWFGDGLNPWWPLLWFAPIPVLLLALRSSWRGGASAAFLAWFLGAFTMWHYLRVLGVPSVAAVFILSIFALVFTAATLLFRALARRGASWSALLAFPATWVSYEYLNGILSSDGTAGSLSYTQLKFLPFLQLASITGPWGMSFLLFLFPAALAMGLHLRHTAPKQAARIVCTGLSAVALVLMFGAVRLALPRPHRQVPIGLVASDLPANSGVAAAGAPTERLLREYAAEAEALAARGAKVIVLPEHLGAIEDRPRAQNADAIFQVLADNRNATIVVGVSQASPPAKYNEARIYAPGTAVLTYEKHHLLPPVEFMFTPGKTLTVLREPSAIWGVAICKDMDFTGLSRDYGAVGLGLMLVPAWDFDLDRLWHGHIAVMRGVEDGFSVARAARNGYLTVSDDRGRILAEARSDRAPFATLMALAPATHDPTPYLLFGDWFAWLTMAALAFTLVSSGRDRLAVSRPAR